MQVSNLVRSSNLEAGDYMDTWARRRASIRMSAAAHTHKYMYMHSHTAPHTHTHTRTPAFSLFRRQDIHRGGESGIHTPRSLCARSRDDDTFRMSFRAFPDAHANRH
jgi:hypothetical protein